MPWKSPGELQKTLEPGSHPQRFWFTWCGAWPGLQNLLLSPVILMHEQVWEPETKDPSEQMAPRCLPSSFLKGVFPGHGMESSTHWGPSLLSPFSLPCAGRVTSTAQKQFGLHHPSPIIRFQTVIHAGPASGHLPFSASPSQLRHPSFSCVTKPELFHF